MGDRALCPYFYPLFFDSLMRRLLLSASALCLFSPSAFAEEPLQARAEANWRYGQERSILMSEFWVPIAQDDESVLYGDLRMMGDDHDNREGNIGVGYRQMLGFKNLKGVGGAHAWLDRRITERGSHFHQITLGAEWLGDDMDVRLNGYIPLSDKREIEIPNANPQAPAFTGTGIVVDTNGRILEEPQGGFDIELGWELGSHIDFIKDHTDSVRVYGGAYYFDGENTENVAGWRTRLAADITQDVQIGARFQRDDERGSQGFLEATIRFPFGQKKSYRREGLRARLDESPERDIDIVTGDVVTDTGDRVQVLNNTTGAAQEVLHVNNTAAGGGDGSAETPFNTLSDAQAAASAQTIIYVHTGDGGTTGQDQGVTLNKTGQQLIGAGADFIYDSGRFSTENGASPTSILIAAAGTAPKITNVNASSDGVRVTANDITVTGITVDGATRDGIVVEADGAGASATGVNISNVTAQNNRMGIFVHGTNGGSVSAKVQGSVTTANSQHGIAVYDDTSGTFEADLGGGALGSTGNNVLAGNTLEDLAVEYDGRALSAQNNWWGQASGADTDTPDIGIAPQIYYGAPINDGLVGHWTFDTEWTTNTTAYDRSSQGNNGALAGVSLANLISGKNKQTLDFAGGKALVTQNATLNNVMTGGAAISYWIKMNSSSIGYTPILEKDQNPTGWLVYLAGGNNPRLLLRVGGAIESNYSAAIPTDNQWYHMTHVFNTDRTHSIYIDGTFIGTSGAISAAPTNIKNLAIGDSGTLDGEIDDLRLYDEALNASQSDELYRMDTSSTVNTSNFLTAAP